MLLPSWQLPITHYQCKSDVFLATYVILIKSTLHRLMKRIQTRELIDLHQREDLWEDWGTSEVMITTIWPGCG